MLNDCVRNFAVRPLVPVSSSYVIVVPAGGNGTDTQPAGAAQVGCIMGKPAGELE